MKIVFMNGGLGNQMFQYIFFRWLELNSGDECFLDDSPFFGDHVAHNGYELERLFGVQPRRLSQYFDADIWDYMVRQRVGVAGIAQQLKDAGMEFSFICDANTYHYDGVVTPLADEAKYVQVPMGDTYYHGYWLGNVYFEVIKDILRRELVFPALTDGRNRDYQSLIRQSNAVAIHIRRGDMAAFGVCSGPAYFAKMISLVEGHLDHARYFLFSDDFSWCREHWQELGLASLQNRVTCVEGNAGPTAYIDMQLMAQCRNFISDRSSFSLLASILNTDQNKIVLSRWQ